MSEPDLATAKGTTAYKSTTFESQFGTDDEPPPEPRQEDNQTTAFDWTKVTAKLSNGHIDDTSATTSTSNDVNNSTSTSSGKRSNPFFEIVNNMTTAICIYENPEVESEFKRFFMRARWTSLAVCAIAFITVFVFVSFAADGISEVIFFLSGCAIMIFMFGLALCVVVYSLRDDSPLFGPPPVGMTRLKRKNWYDAYEYLLMISNVVGGLTAAMFMIPMSLACFYRGPSDSNFFWDSPETFEVQCRPRRVATPVIFYQLMISVLIPVRARFQFLIITECMLISIFCSILQYDMNTTRLPADANEGVDKFLMILFNIVVSGGLFYLSSRRERVMRITFKILLEVAQETLQAYRSRQIFDLILSEMLPVSILERFLSKSMHTDITDSATVLYSDVVQFTKWSSTRTANEVVAMLSVLVNGYDSRAKIFGVEKVKTIGDGYWAVTGIPEESDDHALRMTQFALSCQMFVQNANAARRQRGMEWGSQGIKVRIGIHSGSLIGGVVGSRQFSYEVFGETNQVAECAEQSANPGNVLVSETTLERVKEFYAFREHVLLKISTKVYDGEKKQEVALEKEFKSFHIFLLQEPALAAQPSAPQPWSSDHTVGNGESASSTGDPVGFDTMAFGSNAGEVTVMPLTTGGLALMEQSLDQVPGPKLADGGPLSSTTSGGAGSIASPAGTAHASTFGDGFTEMRIVTKKGRRSTSPSTSNASGSTQATPQLQTIQSAKNFHVPTTMLERSASPAPNGAPLGGILVPPAQPNLLSGDIPSAEKIESERGSTPQHDHPALLDLPLTGPDMLHRIAPGDTSLTSLSGLNRTTNILASSGGAALFNVVLFPAPMQEDYDDVGNAGVPASPLVLPNTQLGFAQSTSSNPGSPLIGAKAPAGPAWNSVSSTSRVGLDKTRTSSVGNSFETRVVNFEDELPSSHSETNSSNLSQQRGRKRLFPMSRTGSLRKTRSFGARDRAGVDDVVQPLSIQQQNPKMFERKQAFQAFLDNDLSRLGFVKNQAVHRQNQEGSSSASVSATGSQQRGAGRLPFPNGETNGRDKVSEIASAPIPRVTLSSSTSSNPHKPAQPAVVATTSPRKKGVLNSPDNERQVSLGNPNSRPSSNSNSPATNNLNVENSSFMTKHGSTNTLVPTTSSSVNQSFNLVPNSSFLVTNDSTTGNHYEDDLEGTLQPLAASANKREASAGGVSPIEGSLFVSINPEPTTNLEIDDAKPRAKITSPSSNPLQARHRSSNASTTAVMSRKESSNQDSFRVGIQPPSSQGSFSNQTSSGTGGSSGQETKAQSAKTDAEKSFQTMVSDLEGETALARKLTIGELWNRQDALDERIEKKTVMYIDQKGNATIAFLVFVVIFLNCVVQQRTPLGSLIALALVVIGAAEPMLRAFLQPTTCQYWRIAKVALIDSLVIQVSCIFLKDSLAGAEMAYLHVVIGMLWLFSSKSFTVKWTVVGQWLLISLPNIIAENFNREVPGGVFGLYWLEMGVALTISAFNRERSLRIQMAAIEATVRMKTTAAEEAVIRDRVFAAIAPPHVQPDLKMWIIDYDMDSSMHIHSSLPSTVVMFAKVSGLVSAFQARDVCPYYLHSTLALLFADLERHIQCTEFLIKIKTVGELLIIVGPVTFDENHPKASNKAVRVSCLDAVQLAIEMRESVQTFFDRHIETIKKFPQTRGKASCPDNTPQAPRPEIRNSPDASTAAPTEQARTQSSVLDENGSVQDEQGTATPVITQTSSGMIMQETSTLADLIEEGSFLSGGNSPLNWNMQVGLHVGPITGAVLGSSRVAFDIFGPTVNMASRVMSTAGQVEDRQLTSSKSKASRASSDLGVISCSSEFQALVKRQIKSIGIKLPKPEFDNRRKKEATEVEEPKSTTAPPPRLSSFTVTRTSSTLLRQKQDQQHQEGEYPDTPEPTTPAAPMERQDTDVTQSSTEGVGGILAGQSESISSDSVRYLKNQALLNSHQPGLDVEGSLLRDGTSGSPTEGSDATANQGGIVIKEMSTAEHHHHHKQEEGPDHNDSDIIMNGVGEEHHHHLIPFSLVPEYRALKGVGDVTVYVVDVLEGVNSKTEKS